MLTRASARLWRSQGRRAGRSRLPVPAPSEVPGGVRQPARQSTCHGGGRHCSLPGWQPPAVGRPQRRVMVSRKTAAFDSTSALKARPVYVHVCRHLIARSHVRSLHQHGFAGTACLHPQPGSLLPHATDVDDTSSRRRVCSLQARDITGSTWQDQLRPQARHSMDQHLSHISAHSPLMAGPPCVSRCTPAELLRCWCIAMQRIHEPRTSIPVRPQEECCAPTWSSEDTRAKDLDPVRP